MKQNWQNIFKPGQICLQIMANIVEIIPWIYSIEQIINGMWVQNIDSVYTEDECVNCAN